MVGKSTHLQVITQQSAQKRNKFTITDMREKPEDFFYCTTRASVFNPAIILPT